MKLHDIFKMKTGNWAVVDNKYTVGYIKWLEESLEKRLNVDIYTNCELKKAVDNLLAIQDRFRKEEMDRNLEVADVMLEKGIL